MMGLNKQVSSLKMHQTSTSTDDPVHDVIKRRVVQFTPAEPVM